MSADVPKVIAGAVLGPPSDSVVVTKVVAFVVYNTSAAPPAGPGVRKKVSARGRIVYTG